MREERIWPHNNLVRLAGQVTLAPFERSENILQEVERLPWAHCSAMPARLWKHHISKAKLSAFPCHHTTSQSGCPQVSRREKEVAYELLKNSFLSFLRLVVYMLTHLLVLRGVCVRVCTQEEEKKRKAVFSQVRKRIKEAEGKEEILSRLQILHLGPRRWEGKQFMCLLSLVATPQIKTARVFGRS